jgi:hypothetical protein
LSSPVCQKCLIDLYRKMTEQFRPELFDDSGLCKKINQMIFLPIFLWHCIPKQTHILFWRYMLCDIKEVYIYNIRTLSVNIKFICTSLRNRQNSEPLASFSCLFRSECKWILYLTTMYVYCVYPAMSKKSENLSDLDKKDRNKRHSSPFMNVVKGVFFVVRVTSFILVCALRST